ncbi:MAG: two-component system chemotaxis sensor kinase CheA, partial [Francisellaceae bacterium]
MAIDPKLYQELVEIFKDELTEQHQLIIDSLLALEESSDKVVADECLQVLFRSSHNIKGAAKSVSIDSIAAISHRLEDVFSEWREGISHPKKESINFCLAIADNLLIALQDFSQKKSRPIDAYFQPIVEVSTSIPSQAPELRNVLEDQIKIPLIKLKHINAKIDDFLTHKLKLNSVLKEIDSLYKNIPKTGNGIVEKKLIQIKNQLELMTDDFARNFSAVQSDLYSLRLQPISDVLIPLKRTARDLSKALNKPISFEIEGGEIKIDRSILLLLRGPFQHLMRNSIEHGIEDTSTRLNKSKPATAIISVKVSQHFGSVYIEFRDNGRGLDKNKILEKVKNKLKYTQEEMARLNDEKLYDLIFQPGFSTQKEVSELSGRGVGLDSVRRNIEQAKGHVGVVSAEGKGTSFNIVVPQNLSSSRGVFVRSNSVIYVLPTRCIKKLFFINSNEIYNKSDKNSNINPMEPKKKDKDQENDIFEHYLEQSNESLVFIQHKKRTSVCYLNLLTD